MATDGRPNLTRELIAETALRLTDEDGLSGLSMRKLGAELGVEAMSLYHYVSNKDDLLDAVLDRLYAEIELPRDIPDDDWERATREGLASFNQVLLRHQAALELFATRSASTPASHEVLYWSYRRFEVVGLTPEESVLALRSAVSFVMGHAVSEFGVLGRGEQFDLSTIADPEVQTFLTVGREVDGTRSFEWGIDLVVAGLRAVFDLP
ncbi:MAG: TetR/AcrR family transcriptional regulator C-terminal domain-containing protein [Actinomycetota bacterium]